MTDNFSGFGLPSSFGLMRAGKSSDNAPTPVTEGTAQWGQRVARGGGAARGSSRGGSSERGDGRGVRGSRGGRGGRPTSTRGHDTGGDFKV